MRSLDSQAMRTFAGIDRSVEAVPDATTLLKFRHLLEAHDRTRQIFGEVGALLSERKLLMREGTIVDATIPRHLPRPGTRAKSAIRNRSEAEIADLTFFPAKAGKCTRLGKAANGISE